jgi:hexosaminidase
MPAVLAAGHRVTNSFKWYLNHGCNNFGDGNWPAFYENEPTGFVPSHTPPEQLELIVGGETTMWAECVDAINFDAVVWPRAAAAAEKLWSPQGTTKRATATVAARLAEHRCRLVARGVNAAPLNDITETIEVGEGVSNTRVFLGGCS